MKVKEIKPKHKIHKSIAALLLITLLILQITAPDVSAAVSTPDIIITASNADTVNALTGTTFTLQLSFKNVSGDDVSSLYIDMSDATNISVVGSGSMVSPGTGNTLNDNTAGTASIPLKFVGDGSSGRIPIRFVYKDSGGNDKETLTSVTVNASKLPDGDPTPLDTSKYKPILTVPASSYFSLKGGQTNALSLSLKNSSVSYIAKIISVTFTPEKDSPFVSAAPTTSLPEIQPGKTADIPLAITVDKYTDAGNYNLPLTISYTNAWGDLFTASIIISLSVENDTTPGLLVLMNDSASPATVNAGSDFTLSFTIKNKGSFPVKDVRISMTGLASDSFQLVSGVNRISYATFAGDESKTVTLKLRAAAALKTGSYPLAFALDYLDPRGNKNSDTQQLWIPVAGAAETTTTIDFQSVKLSASNIKPGGSVTVTVDLNNTGSQDAKQVRISADGGTALFPVTQNLYIMNLFEKGTTKTLSFTFQAQEEAARGSAPINLKLEVPNGDKTDTISQAAAVFVEGKAAAGDASKNVPRIIVKNYASTPTLVKAGENFTLDLSFMNTHSVKTVRNIKATFTVSESTDKSGNVFTPVGASNTFFIDSIAPKKTIDRRLTLYTIPDAMKKTYMVTLSFEYEDTDGNPYKSDEHIGIPVYQPVRLELSEPYIPAEVIMGQPVMINFEMYNMGKTDIYNVRRTVEAEGLDIQPKSQYFGNFESGRNEYNELTINPMKTGDINGRLIINFEDASGEKMEVVKEFSLKVIEQPPIDNGGVGPDGKPIPVGPDGKPLPLDENGNPIDPNTQKPFYKNPLILGVSGGVLLLAVLSAFVLIRKRKKAQEIEF